MRKSGIKTIVPFALAGGALFAASRIKRAARRMDFHGASAVITGGSRGLGLELARALAREGARLSLLSRNAGKLETARQELAGMGADVLVYSCDIKDPENVAGAVDFVMGARGGIDVLINNAGVISVGAFENTDLKDFQDSLAIHALGPVNMIKAVLPHMKKQGAGRIANISSIGGLVGVPHMSSYSAGKFALAGLSDAIRAELAQYGIRVTTVCPGLIRTGAHVNAYFKGDHKKEYAWFSALEGFPILSISSRRAAQRIIKACRYGQARLILTPSARFLNMMDALTPELSADFFDLFAKLLPAAGGPSGNEALIGWESRQNGGLSRFAAIADNQIERNNESRF